MKPALMVSALATALSLSAGVALAADPAAGQAAEQTQEQVYGSQLMMQDERLEHRARLRAAKTAAEREQIGNEHHARMKARATERGVTLPDEPPPKANGMGGGAGVGPGNGGMGLNGGRSRRSEAPF